MTAVDTSREAVEALTTKLTGHHIYGGSVLVADAAATLLALLDERDYWKADSACKGAILTAGVVVPKDVYLAMLAERDRLREALRTLLSEAECLAAEVSARGMPGVRGASVDHALANARAALGEGDEDENT